MLLGLIACIAFVPLSVLLRMRSRHTATGGTPRWDRGTRPGRRAGAALSLGTAAALSLVVGLVGAPAASASQATVQLGTASSFAVLAGTTVTNTGSSVVSGNLGVSPGSAVTGFPPGQVVNGTQHAADATALQAESDLTTGYLDAAGRTPVTTVSSDLGGQTLAPGVYKATSGLALTGTVTLDAQNDPSAVFIFQAGSTLITASNSTVALTGAAQACNVFWQVGSSATLGTGSNFSGSVLALTSATVQTGTTVSGRVLARNGQVSLDDTAITVPACATTSATSTTPTSSSGSTPTTSTPTSSTATTAVIPAGAPSTGAGGAFRSRDNGLLVALGGLALAGAGIATAVAVRRRRDLEGLADREA